MKLSKWINMSQDDGFFTETVKSVIMPKEIRETSRIRDIQEMRLEMRLGFQKLKKAYNRMMSAPTTKQRGSPVLDYLPVSVPSTDPLHWNNLN